MKFFKTRIAVIDRPLDHVITLVLEISNDDLAEFEYSPGQHIVVRSMIDGKEIRRPYALSSSPFIDERPSITIERVKGGVFSQFIFDQGKEGMALEISNAYGMFYADINSDLNQNYYLFAQGIGICSLFSILKSALTAESLSHVFLFYESKNRDNILFEMELTNLLKKYNNRFTLVHTLSHPSILPRLKSWSGIKGKLNQQFVDKQLDVSSITKTDEFYICGAGEMILEVKATLQNMSVNPHNIHTQQYYIKLSSEEKIGDFKTIELEITDVEQTYKAPVNQTILETLKNAGFTAPYACETGICGTCAARLQTGKVEMKRRSALEDIDIEKGWILTCQACPTSDKVTIEFE